jgi:hypothetical protein
VETEKGGGRQVVRRRRKCLAPEPHVFYTEEWVVRNRGIVNPNSRDDLLLKDFLAKLPLEEIEAKYNLSHSRATTLRMLLVKQHLKSPGFEHEVNSGEFLHWKDEDFADRWCLTVRGMRSARSLLMQGPPKPKRKYTKSARSQSGIELNEVWHRPLR